MNKDNVLSTAIVIAVIVMYVSLTIGYSNLNAFNEITHSTLDDLSNMIANCESNIPRTQTCVLKIEAVVKEKNTNK